MATTLEAAVTRLCEDGAAQVAFAAELVLDAGWAPSRIQLEDQPFDVGAHRPGEARPLILAEAEPTATGPGSAAMLAAGVTACAGGPPAKVSRTDQADAEKKYRGLLERRPGIFAVAGPGLVHVFEVRYRAGRASLTPVSVELLAAT